MLTAASEETFPTAACGPCGRTVLAHLEFDPEGNEQRHCVHCNAALDPAEVRWVPLGELDGLGYTMQGEARGCGKGGCGGGQCGAR